MTTPESDLLALLTDIQSRLQHFDEAMAEVPGNIQGIKADIHQLRGEITVMRAVVTDHSYELKAYGERLRDLERNY